MAKDGAQQRVLIRLVSISGLLIACPLLVVSILVYTNYGPLGGIFAFLALPLFFLSLLSLSYVAWRGVTENGISRMEAWWWLSVPHTVVFWLCFLVLRLERFAAHLLAPFILVFMLLTVSTGGWTLVAIFRMARTKGRNLTTGTTVMLILALLVAVILWTLRVNPGR